MASRSLAAALAAGVLACGWAGAQAASPKPVYIHMNGANEFLENLIAVRPGQQVVFVNEDTGPHTIVGYNPATGKTSKRFDGAVAGTKGLGDKVHTYTISFKHQGIVYYYCSVHAVLAKEPGGWTVAKVRPGVHGFGTPMAGAIIVTTDPKLLADNPKTASEKILSGYFGG
ncbi:cupredoxin domain-containing protein [Acidiphilium iwatense]|uniref:Cupredoxin n=1 Tax=Acidiphilium iwatense TaxID=768198 RepID=A0ABS9E4L3_9PROT|nr:Cupredoxin [Acidiphilium iwatense]MCF3948970.1 Cupredoxin [Acidiphilium iwatense]